MHLTRILSALALASLSTLCACAGATPAAASGASNDAGAPTGTAVVHPTGAGTPCGEGPNAALCADGQTCCAGGAVGHYYCASLGDGAACPLLP